MNLNKQTNEVALLMEEFLLDFNGGRDSPLSLLNEIEVKLNALDRERTLHEG